jgi:hypothetical protein
VRTLRIKVNPLPSRATECEAARAYRRTANRARSPRLGLSFFLNPFDLFRGALPVLTGLIGQGCPRGARRAPGAELFRSGGGHYDVYEAGASFAEVLRTEIDFLHRHAKVGTREM